MSDFKDHGYIKDREKTVVAHDLGSQWRDLGQSRSIHTGPGSMPSPRQKGPGSTGKQT